MDIVITPSTNLKYSRRDRRNKRWRKERGLSVGPYTAKQLGARGNPRNAGESKHEDDPIGVHTLQGIHGRNQHSHSDPQPKRSDEVHLKLEEQTKDNASGSTFESHDKCERAAISGKGEKLNVTPTNSPPR